MSSPTTSISPAQNRHNQQNQMPLSAQGDYLVSDIGAAFRVLEGGVPNLVVQDGELLDELLAQGVDLRVPTR